MKKRWTHLFPHHKKEICLMLGVVLLLGIGRCVYAYLQWSEWKHANETVQAYTILPSHAKRNTWEDAKPDAMTIVQQQSEAQGMQLLSFQAMQRDGRQYTVELQGNYENYIQFFNKMEEMMPFTAVDIIHMERGENQIICKICL